MDLRATNKKSGPKWPKCIENGKKNKVEIDKMN